MEETEIRNQSGVPKRTIRQDKQNRNLEQGKPPKNKTKITDSSINQDIRYSIEYEQEDTKPGNMSIH